ncbi:MAG: tandem-95 repeat protein, partial [Magnetococcales bacterium]|nr:tandem-95 repeat protein [Magnetococcales bacterium]
MKRASFFWHGTFQLVWLLLVLLSPLELTAATYGISSTNKYAWSENGGWVNFRPTQGGVTILPDHLAGYAWGENIGWIALGADGAGPYTNTTATNWGVNKDASGNLSGYGWSETVGWINFTGFDTATTPKILTTGTFAFSGYVWSANIGWIRLSNTSTSLYKVVKGNTIPSLSAIANQNINEDGNTGSLTFTTGDADTVSPYFVVTATSSNTTLLPNANLVITGSGSSRTLVATPMADQFGSAVITVTATNGNPVDYTTTKTFNVTVAPVNDPPKATNSATLTTNEDSELKGTLSATDIDSPSLTYAIVTQPTKGSVTITNTATGAFTYTPTRNANGAESFTFKVNDGSLDSNSATVNITINPVNDAPTATDDSFSTDEDKAFSGTLLGTDIENNTLTYSIVTSPKHGNVAITNGTAAFTYTPAKDYNGTDSFTFKVNDGTVDSNVATMTITINPVNDPPTIGGIPSTGVAENVAYSFIPTASDVDGDSLTFAIQKKPAWATFDTTTGALTGKPTSTDQGSYADIVISVTDGKATASLQPFTITVANVNTLPTITNIPEQNGTEDGTIGPIAFTIGDLDTPADQLIVTASSANAILIPTDNSHLVLGGTGANRTLTIKPGANQNGSTQITVTVSDDNGLAVNSTFKVNVAAVNDLPTITGVPTTTKLNPGNDWSFTPVANDVDGDPLTFSIQNKPSWANFDQTTGRLFGKPLPGQYGNYNDIVISVTAGLDTVSLAPFSIAVEDVTNPDAAGTTGGIFKSAQTITLTCQDDGSGCASLYYTLDGSQPTILSTLYTAPITLTANTVLNYIAVDKSGRISKVMTENFTIDTTPPKVEILNPVDGAILKSPTINGTAIDTGGTGIQSVVLQISDGINYLKRSSSNALVFTQTKAEVNAITVNEFAEWDLFDNIPWEDGNYTITATVTDKAGNVTTTNPVHFTKSNQINISGTILNDAKSAVPDVSVTFKDAVNAKIVTVQSSTLGKYSSGGLDSDWSGSATPTKQGYTFTPPSYNFSNLLSSKANMDFIASAVESEDARVIIMAGGDLNDYLWPATNSAANFAYKALIYKGILKENIRYLSINTEQSNDIHISGLSSSANLESAITSWAGGYVNAKKPLIIYLVGHGLNDRFFATKPLTSESDIVQASSLNGWLNTLQEKTGAKVTLIIDSCLSGSFLKSLKPPVGVKVKRITIASTNNNSPAYFSSEGDLSFSSFFWRHIMQGLSLQDSFTKSSKAIQTATNDKQIPMF